MNEQKNIQEEFYARKEYYTLGNELYNHIMKRANQPLNKVVIAIGGESGCGKSTTAVSLQKVFRENGLESTLLHMDSYFNLAPKNNHQNRLKSLENVGPHELNFDLINKHINYFKNRENQITIPVVNYLKNSFSQKDINISNINILIIEGVYSFLCEHIDFKVFIDRTYHDTYQNRKKRTREVYDPFIESILEIEHQIVRPMINKADFVIQKNYALK